MRRIGKTATLDENHLVSSWNVNGAYSKRILLVQLHYLIRLKPELLLVFKGARLCPQIDAMDTAIASVVIDGYIRSHLTILSTSVLIQGGDLHFIVTLGI